jgi:ABC-type oligopeptide transport system substrate-binding subunit
MANVDAIQILFSQNAHEQVAKVERGELDYVSPAPNLVPDLRDRFGVNRGRLHVRPAPVVRFLAFNHDRPLFRDNVRLRRAINFAVDRAHIARQRGAGTGRRTDQVLPHAMPGFVDAALFPLAGADVERARLLARGALRGGRAVLYAVDEPPWRQMAEVVRFNLAQIGIEAEVRLFETAIFVERTERRGEPWDIALTGWIADYLDPANFFEPLFHGRSIRADGTLNSGYFDVPAWNRRIDRAAALTGEARYAAFAALDRDLMREAVPIAPLVVDNTLHFTSARLGCVGFHPFGFVNYAALCIR